MDRLDNRKGMIEQHTHERIRSPFPVFIVSYVGHHGPQHARVFALYFQTSVITYTITTPLP